jgi:hypothetical protein
MPWELKEQATKTLFGVGGFHVVNSIFLAGTLMPTALVTTAFFAKLV